jgi:hypothetical protein
LLLFRSTNNLFLLYNVLLMTCPEVHGTRDLVGETYKVANLIGEAQSLKISLVRPIESRRPRPLCVFLYRMYLILSFYMNMHDSPGLPPSMDFIKLIFKLHASPRK